MGTVAASSRRGSFRHLHLAAAIASVAFVARAALGGEVDVPNGTTDLTTLGATATSDVTFTAGTTYAPTTFTVPNGGALNAASLDDLDATQALTIQNGVASTTSTLTLNGGGANAVAPSAADLLYVATGGTLTVQNGTGTLNVALNGAGNLDVAGAATVSSAIAMGANAIAKTGAGTLTLNAANAGTGGFTIAAGTVGTNNNNGFGSLNNVVTLGVGAANATILITGAPSGFQPAITVAAGAGTRTITSNNGTAFGSNGVVFSSGSPITLNHDLIVAETGVGNIQFRNVIGQSGGTYGIAVDAASTGYLDFRGANTFAGGVAVNGGILVAGVTGTGAAGAVTAGPFGTGTVTLGAAASATPATLAVNSNFSILNALAVNAGGARTLSQLSAGSGPATYSGAIALNGDLTIAAVATTLTTGGNRLRLDGSLSGNGNVIVNNANANTGAAAGSGAVRLGGATSNATWTGNLIVQAGQASLNTNAAIGANNAVAVAPNGLFNFSEATLSPTIAGLNNATNAGVVGGAAGGVVTATVNSSRALTLGGTGAYVFGGTITDNPTPAVVAPNNAVILIVNLATAGASQTLAGASTYTGATTIANGKLRLANATGSATGGGVVNLGSATLGTPTNATLAGTGTSTGLLTAIGGARLAPGMNAVDADASGRTNFGVAGTLSAGTTGGMTLTNAAADFDLAATAAGASDRILTGGTFTPTALAFAFNELAPGTLDTSAAYTLVSGFTNAPDLAGITGTVLQGGYAPTFSLSGNALQVTFASTTAAPEPASLVGLAGVVAIVARRRRTR